MIAYLTGQIISIDKDKIIVNANGVGYEVNCTQKIADNFTNKNECELLIKTIVKEDDITLYGFETSEEKRWFQIITDVQGVGPRMGLSVLNTYNYNTLHEIILSEDIASLKAISGIGPKVASRIINELKSRKDLSGANTATADIATDGSNTTQPAKDDAISALVNLGFDRKKVFFAVKKITNNNDSIELEEVIKLALVELNNS